MNQFFNFDGRARRSELWSATVIVIFLGLVALGVVTATGGPQSLVRWIVTLVGLALIGPVVVRRVHDRDRPAWLAIPFWLAPQVLALLPGPQSLPLPLYLAAAVFGLGVIMIGLWGLIELYFLPGTAGENRYGPDRRASTASG